MNDSRLDRIASLVSDAELETDLWMQRRIATDALDEYVELADEFPVTDSEIRLVVIRLQIAIRFTELGDWRSASWSLHLAGKAIETVKNR